MQPGGCFACSSRPPFYSSESQPGRQVRRSDASIYHFSRARQGFRRKQGLGVQSRHEVGWVEPEAIRLFRPCIADGLVRRETAEGLETFGEVVGVQEGRQM